MMRGVEQTYRVDEAARILRVGTSTLYKRTGSGEVKTIRVLGGRTRITASELVRQGAVWADDEHVSVEVQS
jgi:excisionase family DNA binding protein